MEYIRDRIGNIPFSLHDSRIIHFQYQDHTLVMELDQIFAITQEEEKSYAASIVFTDIDINDCDILLFDQTIDEGDFTGKVISLKDYMDQFQHAEFEILTEGYHGYHTMFTGWIWCEGRDPVTGIMNLWNTGDMLYEVIHES